ncbi:MAG TPA: FISUMP domain-containing protein, partial [Methylococcales bacterium]
YNNWDAYSGTPGDNADGFDIGFVTYRAGSDRVNYLKGCRAWGNGDDGFDMYQMAGYHGIYVLENCWSFKNGYYPDGITQGGNGCGFKYGNDDAYGADAVVRRTTTNCIAYANRTRGFSQETADIKMIFYNNIAYLNGLEGFNFITYNLADILKNNISYNNGSSDVFQAAQTHDHNDWDSAVTVTDGDFVSVNGLELTGTRVAGALPLMTFLHLAASSDLINAGVNVGLATDGDGQNYNLIPSLGPFEYIVSGSNTIIQCQDFNDTNTGTSQGFDIPRTDPTDLIFRNNSLESVATDGYMLQAGDDSPAQSATFNNLDGEIITGNKFVWNGTDIASVITHGLFTGHNINGDIRYNYLKDVPMAIVRKSTITMTNTSGGVAYNILNNPHAVGVVIKGINNQVVYNNTFYSAEPVYTIDSVPGTWRGLVDIYTNTDIVPNVPATGAKIKNNIFYTKHQIYNIYIYDAACLTDFESDYNIFYCEDGDPMFNYLGTPKTFLQWQALGFDANSVVVNPNFIDFVDFVPAARLDYGDDLGALWGAGLSFTAQWTICSPPGTANQDATWQVGARVYGTSIPLSFVAVTNITVNSSYDVIATNDGALQMTINILPGTATIQTVTWSVIPGTGSAVITADGYLQAVTNGTVTVRATAQDGSGVYGEKTITISNQLAALPAPTANALYNWWAVSKHIETNAIKDVYGALYNGYAVETGLLAPTGWHVPTKTELDDLIAYLGGVTVAGGHLKEAGSTHWGSVAADNSSGFTAVGTGHIRSDGGFEGLLSSNYIFTSTSSGIEALYVLILGSVSTATSVTGTWNKFGNSVRLIKDDSINPGTLTDIDGNIYDCVTIGTQVWIKQNLRTEHYNDGTSIPNIIDNATWAADTAGAMCFYDNTPTIIGEYLLPPIGWHVPTKDEFDTLVANLSGNMVAGGHLKEIG